MKFDIMLEIHNICSALGAEQQGAKSELLCIIPSAGCSEIHYQPSHRRTTTAAWFPAILPVGINHGYKIRGAWLRGFLLVEPTARYLIHDAYNANAS